MGVPRLSIWTRTTFPKAIRQFRKGEYRAKVDNVYVDCNAILHGSMQSSYQLRLQKANGRPVRRKDLR